MQASTQFAGGSEGGNPNNYRFVFHYNPPNFAFDLQAGKTSPILGTDQSIDPLTAAASVSLSFLINRQEEVASRTQTAHRVAHLQNFGDLGTMYDVEFLLRVCSGDPSPDSETAYNNWLKMNLIDVYFSPMVRFHGYVVDINVNHVMFNVYMIPTITEVQVSMTGIYDSTPSASADGDLNPFSGTDLVPVGANGVSAGVKQK